MLKQEEYADIGGADTAVPAWGAQEKQYEEYNKYFYGDVFRDAVKIKLGDSSEDPPLLYPLKVNLIKMMVMTHVQMFLGQWEDQIFEFTADQVRRGQRLDQWGEKAAQLLYAIWQESNFNSRILDGAVSTMLYGGAVYKATFDMTLNTRVRIEHILPEYFYPRWHPMDPDKLLWVKIAFAMPMADAVLAYGYEPSFATNPDDTVLYQEYWNDKEYAVYIGGERQAKWSGTHPYGFIPFVYIPRIRMPGDFYGMAVPEDIMGLQDELNMRLADVGDRINVSAHPQYVLSNYTGQSTEWAIGPDEVINLGVSMSGLEPKLDVIDPPGEPASTFKYLEFLLDLAQMSAMAPPVAFGVDEGSQRSGMTLFFRMWPLVQQARMTRLNWVTGLSRLHDMMLQIRIIKDKGRDTADAVGPSIRTHRIIPRFAPVLPRDRLELVDEIVKAWSQGPQPLISPEAAVDLLGFTDDHPKELERVYELWAKFEKMEKQKQQQQMKQQAAKETTRKEPASA